jgi:hypothetical protein
MGPACGVSIFRMDRLISAPSRISPVMDIDISFGFKKILIFFTIDTIFVVRCCVSDNLNIARRKSNFQY